MDYHTIDVICDSTNPALFLWAVLLLFFGFYRKSENRYVSLVSLVFGLAVVYGLQFLDSTFGLWAAYRLDYSTHSAFALVMVLAISILLSRVWIPFIILAIYLSLVIYQRYHSEFDVLSSLIAVSLPTVVASALTRRLTVKEAKV